MSLAVGIIGAGVMGAEHARLLRHETGGAHLAAVADADPGEIVSTEAFFNAGYGYHVHAEFEGREGTARPTQAGVNRVGRGVYECPELWVPRLAQAYRDQMQAWVRSLAGGSPVGASAWDGYCATAIAEQLANRVERGRVQLSLPPRPSLYA